MQKTTILPSKQQQQPPPQQQPQQHTHNKTKQKNWDILSYISENNIFSEE